MLVRPVATTTETRRKEQDRQLEQQQFRMNETVDHSFPPYGFPHGASLQPSLVGQPVAWLVDSDDAKDLAEHPIAEDQGMMEKDVELSIAASFGQCDDTAHLSEVAVILDKRILIEVVDAQTEHDLDEAVDMPAGPVDRVGHSPALFPPALEHQIVLILVVAMLLDLRDECLIVG